jgi:hypothetical protein
MLIHVVWSSVFVNQIIDNKGNLFGIINIIDALVILTLVAVMMAGVTLATDSALASLVPVGLGVLGFVGAGKVDSKMDTDDTDEEQFKSIQLRVNEIEPAVAEAMAIGDTALEDDMEIIDLQSEAATVVVESNDGTLVERPHPRQRTVTMIGEISSEKTRREGFRGDRLYVGRELHLDLDQVRVEASVVGFEDELPTERAADWGTVPFGENTSVAVAD